MKLLPLIVIALIANIVMISTFKFLHSDIPEELMTDFQAKIIYGTYLMCTIGGVAFVIFKRKQLFVRGVKFWTWLTLSFCTPIPLMIVALTITLVYQSFKH